jgi:hypothetical protein
MTAIFKHSAESYPNWFSLLGTDRVEVLVPNSRINCAGPGRPPKAIDASKFYQVDVASLSAVQRQRLVRYLSKKWKQPVSVIEEWISDSRNGIPLIAGDVVVAMGLFQ